MQKPASSKRNSVRIIAGEFRSRKLEFPNVEGLRPTADRIRETLFNWLQDSIQGETCLDLFSGSGALGFEALSRGAKQVDFVEKDRIAASCIRGNLERFNIARGTLYCADAFDWLAAQQAGMSRYGLVFLDPPFNEEFLADACIKLDASGLLRKSGLVYIETADVSEFGKIPSVWRKLKSKKAGSVNYSLYQAQ